MLSIRSFAAGAALAVAVVPAAPAAAASSAVTLAGDGRLGITDGPAATASFALPLAAAVAPSGDVYVADAGAQRIRLVRSGVVTTVAGSGGPVRGSPQWPVAGGFADGPADRAQFSRPSGIAVARDGTVFVADAANYCIRAIRAATVSTYAGACATSVKPVDGPRMTARFGYVRQLALDSAGNLFVADYNTGVRRIAADGTVTTLPLPAGAKLTIGGVAVWGEGAKERIFVSDRESLMVIDASTLRGRRFTDAAEGGRRFGMPDALAALGPREVAFTDAMYNTVRIFRDEAPTGAVPGSVTWQVDVASDAEFRAAGDAEGSSRDTRFAAPRGIAAGPHGDLIVVDTGNRRIRSIAGFDARIPVELGDDVAALRKGGIAIAGGSNVFYDTVWERSTPGALERFLPARARTFVEAYRFRDGDLGALRDTVTLALRTKPRSLVLELTTNDTAGAAAPALEQAVAFAVRSARSAAIPLLVVTVPVGSEIGPYEGAATTALAVATADATRRYDAFAAAVRRLAPGAVLDAAAALRALATAPEHVALSSSDDRHLSDAGGAAVARAIAAALPGGTR
jgi:sugar lactone lactonase YvrE